MQPARLAHGEGKSHIGINRREMGPDGYIFLGEDPNKPIDPIVGVVRVDDLNGKPIATLFSYGCHTVVVGPNSRVSSPDFPGASREVIETALGGLSLYLQGGGGDIMPVGGMGWEEDCRDGKNRVGMALAGEVLRVAAGLRTNVRKGERTWLPSLLGPGMTLTPWVPVEGHAAEHFEAISQTIQLDLIPFPTLAEAQRLRAERQRDAEDAEASGEERRVTVANRFLAWADGLIKAIAEGAPRTADFEVQALRINDVSFVSLSAEVFSQTTVELRRRSPFEHTMALGYTNGVVCYLPRAEDYPPGGWRVDDRYRIPDLVFQAYLLPTGLQPDSEQRVVTAALGLLQQLGQPVGRIERSARYDRGPGGLGDAAVHRAARKSPRPFPAREPGCGGWRRPRHALQRHRADVHYPRARVTQMGRRRQRVHRLRDGQRRAAARPRPSGGDRGRPTRRSQWPPLRQRSSRR